MECPNFTKCLELQANQMGESLIFCFDDKKIRTREKLDRCGHLKRMCAVMV